MVIQIWPEGIIYYEFQRNLINFISLVLPVMEDIEKSTNCISFVARSDEDNFLLIQHGQRCSSFIGMKGGEQRLSLDFNNFNKNMIRHELCHAIGLQDEHRRRNRDKYLVINYENVLKGKEFQLGILAAEDDIHIGEIDFESIMMPDENTFGKKSIVATSGRRLIKTCDKHKLSQGDIAKIRVMYTKRRKED